MELFHVPHINAQRCSEKGREQAWPHVAGPRMFTVLLRMRWFCIPPRGYCYWGGSEQILLLSGTLDPPVSPSVCCLPPFLHSKGHLGGLGSSVYLVVLYADECSNRLIRTGLFRVTFESSVFSALHCLLKACFLMPGFFGETALGDWGGGT